MNDIFKIFKKKSQAGKTTCVLDIIKDLNEKEQEEIVAANRPFERANKSYLSISKSGRLKSKRAQHADTSRQLRHDMFSQPVMAHAPAAPTARATATNGNDSPSHFYDSGSSSDEAASYRSSLEDFERKINALS
jgi:hypothetical protein